MKVAVSMALSHFAIHAQTTGTIVGQISDASNAAVSGANVEAQNVETRLTRAAVTSADGAYLIPVAASRHV